MNEMTRDSIKICQALKDHGHKALFAGGAVRDMLMNREPHDIDIATDASPDQVEAIFDRTNAVGKQFGVVRVWMGNTEFEIATFRSDVNTDGRHADVAFNVTEKDDASRRDFTVNAMFFDPFTETVVDFFNGRKDIENKKLRFVGDAEQRIQEDFLRVLRAARFSVTLGFQLDDATKQVICDNADKMLEHVSIERVKQELDKMFAANPSLALDTLNELGLLKAVLPEVHALVGEQHSRRFHSEGDVFEHTKRVADNVLKSSGSVNLVWAALLHDTGKPATVGVNKHGDLSNIGHEAVSAKIAEEVTSRFKFSKDEAQEIVFTVRNHMMGHKLHLMRPIKVVPLVDSKWFPSLMHVAEADMNGSVPLPEWRLSEERINNILDFHKKLLMFRDVAPSVTGKTLIAQGQKPGPSFKQKLLQARAKQLSEFLK
jgi:poly(A) polymerase